MADKYEDFIRSKGVTQIQTGFDPVNLAPHLFDFQSAIVDWACKRGRAAIFADTGLGKTAMQTEWARQVASHTGGRVLILAPLCVAQQTVDEAARFGLAIQYCRSEEQATGDIIITNYEMIDHFAVHDYAGVVLDESSILKSHDSKTRAKLIEAFSRTPYRLSCTATPSPNDHMELGNQAAFLGVMTAAEMLAMFFVHDGGETANWRLKGHGKQRFWEWMSTWSICIRNPSDLGFDGSRYILPGLKMHEHVIDVEEPLPGQLFSGIAQTLTERRDAKRQSMAERVALVKNLVLPRLWYKMATSTTGDRHALEAGVRQNKTGEGQSGPGLRGEAQNSGGAERCEGPQGVHGGIRQSKPGEVQANAGSTGGCERGATGEIRVGRDLPSGGAGEVKSMAGVESNTAESAAHIKIRAIAGAVQRDDGCAVASMCDMRPQRSVAAKNVSAGGSLPLDGEGARAGVHELQHGARQVQGRHGPDATGDCISGIAPRPWLIWCHLNAEQDALEEAFGDLAFSVRGSMLPDEKEAATHGWLRGDRPIMLSKASILGFGLNFQHCSDMVFAGLDDSFESFYQAVRRCYRFGQTEVVNVHLVSSSSEGAVKANLERKQAQATDMAESMVSHMRTLTQQIIRGATMEKYEYARDIAQGEGWTIHLGDCVDVASSMPDGSVDYSVFSPPFASMYTYTNSDRDMGNCRTYGAFYKHFNFLIDQLFRITKPGRLLSFHCMNLQTSKLRDGVIGLHDFRGNLIRMFEDAGWIYHSEVCIWKDPVTAMQRTKALGLLHKTIRKDSSMSRQGIADYLVTMRKPGENAEPIAHSHESFPVELWQRYASPVWMDINPSNTLQYRNARESDDERHIAPLQLEVIERAIELWSNRGDLVFSPFTGIGSEGYVSLEMGRRFVGAELKRSYLDLAVRNLREAREHVAGGLFADCE